MILKCEQGISVHVGKTETFLTEESIFSTMHSPFTVHDEEKMEGTLLQVK